MRQMTLTPAVRRLDRARRRFVASTLFRVWLPVAAVGAGMGVSALHEDTRQAICGLVSAEAACGR